MFLYITSGTPDYMEKLQKKYEKEQMIIVYGSKNTLLLHETKGKTKFSTPRKYEIVASNNPIEQRGFFAFHHIPVDDEARPIFEQQFLTKVRSIEKEAGFISYRLLRPIKSDTYIFLSQWIGPRSYEVWKNSKTFKQLQQNEVIGEKKQNIFNAASYITTYSGGNEKQKES